MIPIPMRNWLRRSAEISAPPGVPSAAVVTPPAAPPTEPPPVWSPDRLAVTDALWGDGFALPGGEREVLRLARNLKLTSTSSLLLLGMAGGGAAVSIIRDFGTRVIGLEVEPALLAGSRLLARSPHVASRIRIDSWEPHDPAFPPRHFHHAMAIEPLRHGNQPEPLLHSLGQTLKPGGQLVMLDLVADAPLAADDPTARHWAAFESRSAAAVPVLRALPRMLARVGFDVRSAEDVSDEYMRNALQSWRLAVRALRQRKPSAPVRACWIAEAELWVMRLRLLRTRKLRMMRWHAICRSPTRS